jgi:hypothetical protein
VSRHLPDDVNPCAQRHQHCRPTTHQKYAGSNIAAIRPHTSGNSRLQISDSHGDWRLSASGRGHVLVLLCCKAVLHESHEALESDCLARKKRSPSLVEVPAEEDTFGRLSTTRSPPSVGALSACL